MNELDRCAARVEELLLRYGAVPAGTSRELAATVYSDGSSVREQREKQLWRLGADYIRMDWMYFQKPFLVLEFSDRPEGPYEDADPFPFDLPDDELEEEVRFALGLEK